MTWETVRLLQPSRWPLFSKWPINSNDQGHCMWWSQFSVTEWEVELLTLSGVSGPSTWLKERQTCHMNFWDLYRVQSTPYQDDLRKCDNELLTGAADRVEVQVGSSSLCCRGRSMLICWELSPGGATEQSAVDWWQWRGQNSWILDKVLDPSTWPIKICLSNLFVMTQ